MFDGQPIILGIIIAVSSGVVLIALRRVGRILRACARKRKQVAHVRSMVVGSRDLILTTSEDIYVPPLDKVLRRDDIRQADYNDMRRRLESALQDGCPNLSYDEIQQIRSVFRPIPPEVRLNEEGYKTIFGKL